MKDIEIHRVNGQYPTAQIQKAYDQYGIVVLKQYMPASGRDALRRSLESKLQAARSIGAVQKLESYPDVDFLLGDVLAVRELEPVNYVFFQKELLEATRAVLRTEELVYWGDSSVQFGEGARGFHKDNVERLDGSHDDWQGPYGLVRCGVYFQDHVRHSGGLKVRLASHNIATHLQGEIADIASSYGDLVMWSMRLTHSGNNRKLKGLSRFPLHPRLEALAPRAFIVPEQVRRMSAFCSLGKPGSHLDLYMNNMNKRDADWRPYFQRARNPAESNELMKKYGVTFVQPNQYYGELDK